jgi:hypothetical protein
VKFSRISRFFGCWLAFGLADIRCTANPDSRIKTRKSAAAISMICRRRTAHGAAAMLNWLVEDKTIAPHIPVFDKSKRDDGTFYPRKRTAFGCRAENNCSR